MASLRQWASTLRSWEQAALDMIVAGDTLTDADYERLLQYLLEDAGLAEQVAPRPTLRFAQDAVTDSPPPAEPPRLISVSNLQNVNALVPGQTLLFGQALTACYGANGSGKSGYARVLGCAGFTRGDRDVLPDVTQPSGSTTIQSAQIQFCIGETPRVITYEVGEPCEDLASFYVFDSTSVRRHLTDKNKFSFSPAGLSLLEQLAGVTDEVRRRLSAKVDHCLRPHAFSQLFTGESEVSRIIANLEAQTDISSLRQLARWGQEEQRELEQLDAAAVRLKGNEIPAQIESLKRAITDLTRLMKQIKWADYQLGDQAVAEFDKAVGLCAAAQEAAERTGADQFRSAHLSQTGSDAWRQFIQSAKRLADVEGTEAEPYPQPDDRCLLCQQPLSVEAHDLLRRLWAFLESDAETKLNEARRVLDARRQDIQTVDLEFFGEESVVHRYLRQRHPALADRISTFVENARKRREGVLNVVSGSATPERVPLPDSGVPDVTAVITALEAECAELAKLDPTQELAAVERRRLVLDHRLQLGRCLPQVEAYVQGRKWAGRARTAGGSTRHITEKHNELFQQLVTSRYIGLFGEALRTRYEISVSI